MAKLEGIIKKLEDIPQVAKKGASYLTKLGFKMLMPVGAAYSLLESKPLASGELTPEVVEEYKKRSMQKTMNKREGGMADIYDMTQPLGYDNGGDVDLAAIMADMKASRGPAEVRHPIQKIIADRIPVDPYSVSQKERAKELGKKGLGALKRLAEETIGAGAAEGSTLGDMLDTYIPILKIKIENLEAAGKDATGEKNWLEYYEDLRRRQD